MTKWLQRISLVAVGYVVPTAVAVALRKQSPLMIVAGMVTAIFVGALVLSWLTGARVTTSQDRARTKALLAQHDATLLEVERELREQLDNLDAGKQLGELEK